jgi:hypothetical protein
VRREGGLLERVQGLGLRVEEFERRDGGLPERERKALPLAGAPVKRFRSSDPCANCHDEATPGDLSNDPKRSRTANRGLHELDETTSEEMLDAMR